MNDSVYSELRFLDYSAYLKALTASAEIITTLGIENQRKAKMVEGIIMQLAFDLLREGS